jgi:PKHD-type hydroxylase
MDIEWCFYENMFNTEECDKIIDDSKNIEFFQGEVGVNRYEHSSTQKVDNNIRRSKIKFIQENNKNFAWMFEKLWHYAHHANRNFRFDINNLEFVQIAEYDQEYKGCYVTHADVFWFQPEKHYSRKLSCTLQLSDPSEYSGGDFLLEHLDGVYPTPSEKKQMRGRGTGIFFPSFINHSVKEVTRGRRYSITAWFEGPKWR